MALSVLYYSPLTLVYWYGKPAEYEGLPERDFFGALPTVWDETVWLGGEIGEWAAVARRSGRDWFVGAITNESPRTVPIAFDFLPEGATYTARTYGDTPASAPGSPITPGVSRVAIGEQKGVRRGSSALQASLPAAGGAAVWLRVG
jgi:alpha-glucosidase